MIVVCGLGEVWEGVLWCVSVEGRFGACPEVDERRGVC